MIAFYFSGYWIGGMNRCFRLAGYWIGGMNRCCRLTCVSFVYKNLWGLCSLIPHLLSLMKEKKAKENQGDDRLLFFRVLDRWNEWVVPFGGMLNR